MYAACKHTHYYFKNNTLKPKYKRWKINKRLQKGTVTTVFQWNKKGSLNRPPFILDEEFDSLKSTQDPNYCKALPIKNVAAKATIA